MNSILIADTHAICREALCEFIRNTASHLEVDGVSDIGSMEQRIDSGGVDIVLVDESLYQKRGRDYDGSIRLCILTGREGSDLPDNLSGIFYRTMSCKTMLSGLEKVLDGQRFFPKMDDFNDRIPAERISFGKKPSDFHLTTREQEVLSFLVKGASNKEIARALDLQVVTVKLHVRGICRKLKAANRTQAALFAQENGWS